MAEFMDAIHTIGYWVWTNKISLAIILFLFWKGSFIWKYLVHQPLTGGNGKVQMYEFTRYTVVLGWIYVVIYEHRHVELDIAIVLTLAVLGIAKLDKVLEVIRDIQVTKHKKDESKG
jgi:hypothetical protein